MSIIDPRTGLPTNLSAPTGPAPSVAQADLIKILSSQRYRIDMLNQQNMQLGLYIEFILEHLLAMTDVNGDPLLVINIEDFQPFAERRLTEIQTQLAEHEASKETQAANTVLSQMPENISPAIELNE